MREILFRGKRVDNGEWAEGYYAKAKHIISEQEMHIIFPLDLGLFPHSEFSSYEEVDPATIIDYSPRQQWISVEDRLPEPNQKVLAYRADSKGTYEEYRLCFGWALKGAITHWMPLPEPPKET